MKHLESEVREQGTGYQKGRLENLAEEPTHASTVGGTTSRSTKERKDHDQNAAWSGFSLVMFSFLGL